MVGREGRGKNTNSLSESLGCTAISPGDLGQDFAAACNSVSITSAFIQSSDIYGAPTHIVTSGIMGKNCSEAMAHYEIIFYEGPEGLVKSKVLGA